MVVALAALLVAILPASAGAVIQTATTIDGPSPQIVGFGGVAMAPDGSGGAVYLKQVNGVTHVFVSQYTKRKWLAPVQVDGEDAYAASDPRIAAADGGELLVVWATPFASVNEKTVYRLVSSELTPGSQAFGPPVIVDRNIGEADEASPDLAMSGSGTADVVYRVVKPTQRSSIPLLHAGDVDEEVRVARFGGERWADLGEINHDPDISMRAPTSANAPRIALGSGGAAVVVWQEPEADGTARIWARRLFGTTIDYAMLVSATSYHGAPLTYDADAPSLAVSSLGQAEVAYRQLSGPGSPLPGSRIFLNVLPSGEAQSGGVFLGAELVGPELPGGEATAVGRPAVDVDEHNSTRLLYDGAGTARAVEANDLGKLSSALDLAPAFAGSQLTAASELEPVTIVNPAGGGVSAWPSADSKGDPALAVEEDFPDGSAQTALLSDSAGGPIAAAAAGRSGLGDALLAFQQGPVGDAAIVGAGVSAPPTSFPVSVPQGWIKPSQARVEWSPAASADGTLTYYVLLDGHRLTPPPGVQEMALPGQLPNGVHRVQMLAVDPQGQSTLSAPVQLHIGPPPPSVRIASADGGRGITVRVGVPSAGLRLGSVRIAFGDGHRVRSRTYVRHIYARPGRYEVVVSAVGSDGARALLRWVVRVR